MRIWILLTVSLLGTLDLWAAEQPRRVGSVVMHFSGDSTLGTFAGAAPAVALLLHPHTEPTQLAIAAQIPVKSLDSDNSFRDKKIRELLDEPHHPQLVGSVVFNADRLPRKGELITCRLQVRGKTVERKGVIGAVVVKGGRVSFRISSTISLASLGVKAPRIAFVIKVEDSIVIELHCEMEQSLFTPVAAV